MGREKGEVVPSVSGREMEAADTAAVLVVCFLSSCAYSTRYPHQVHGREASRSAHYAVASQPHTWRGYQALYAHELGEQTTSISKAVGSG